MCANRLVSEEIICHKVGRFVITECFHRRGSALQRHCHAQTNLTFVVSGRYQESFAGKSEMCTPGAVRLLPAGENHENKFHRDSRYLTVQISPQSFPRIPPNAALYAQAGQIQSPLVEHIGQQLCKELRMRDDLSPLVIEGILYQLLGAIERHLRVDKYEPRWLKPIYQLLQDRFTDDLRLAEIAATAGVHPVHLCREFKKRQRVSIGAYLRQLRIQRACQLLRNSQMPLAEIALECGFSDQSHFSATFKRTMGTTPSAERAGWNASALEKPA